MGFYATETFEAAPPRRMSSTRARRVPARSRNPHRGPTRGVLSGYRYYSPTLGRWLSRDPIGETGGLNLFGFVNNSPVSRWDRLGLAIGCEATCGTGSDPENCCCGANRYNSYKACCCKETQKVHDKTFGQDFVWEGQCGVFSGGYWLGGGYVVCSLRSRLNHDCKMWDVGVQAWFVGITTPGAGAVTFDAVFAGAYGPEGFVGPARMWGGGASVGPVGGNVGGLQLGSASTTHLITFEMGFELGGEIFGGGSSLL